MALAGPVTAGQVTVAVAANFLSTARALSAEFEAAGGDRVVLIHGSTGKLYAQIIAGAPFDVFLSADEWRPARLQAAHLLQPDGRMTYALGRLALIERDGGGPGGPDAVLAGDLRLAIADPALAPYGAAAASLLAARRGVGWGANVVFGENVAQAFAFVATGNAPAGLVGLAQARARPQGLRITEIPAGAYPPIRQDAALLARARDNPAAKRYFAFLGAPPARAAIAAAGYGVTP